MTAMRQTEPRQGMRQLNALLGWLVIAFVAAAIGGMGSAGAPEFYGLLDRPAWAPPAWLFGPVWTILYATMGVAAWLVWRERPTAGTRLRPPLVLFVVQLAVNALWSWVFFVWQSGVLATLNILLLDLLVIATILSFRRISPLAAALLLPYLAWIAFATALTLSTWLRNPALLG